MTLTTEGRTSATTSGTGRDLGGRLSSGAAATEDNMQPIRRTLPATLKLARWPHTIRDSPRPRWYCRIFGKRRKGPITSREPGERLEKGTEELLKLGSPQLHQGLFLDLANPFTGDPQGAANLLQSHRFTLPDAEPEADHGFLTGTERAQRPRHFPRHLLTPDLAVGLRGFPARNEVPEEGFPVPDRMLQGGNILEDLDRLFDLVAGGLDRAGHFLEEWLPAEALCQPTSRLGDPLIGFGHVHGHPDGAGLIRQRAGNPLTDPPRGISAELEPAPVVESLRRFHQAALALLDKI